MRTLLLTVCLILISNTSAVAQCKPTADGVVVDETGNLLAGAKVSLVKQNDPSVHSVIRTFATDASGVFHASVDKGTYIVVAKKEDAGYPETRFAFYGTQPAPVIILDCSSQETGIVVRLGPKAGAIHSVSVMDAATGKPVSNANIAIRWVSKEETSIATSTTYKDIAIPSNVPLTYEISAPGYATSQRAPLQVAPSEHVTLQVTLVPVAGGPP